MILKKFFEIVFVMNRESRAGLKEILETKIFEEKKILENNDLSKILDSLLVTY